VAVAALLYALVTALCLWIPLFDSLGYESSFVTALAGSFIAGFLTIGGTAAALAEAGGGAPDRVAAALAALRRSIGKNLLLLLLPLTFFSVSALVIPNCALVEGAAFFLLLPGVSVVFASALGFFCTIHYDHPRILFTVIAGALLGYSLALGYFTPAIFSYNFLYGYFPGLSYDEELPLRWTLVIFRVLTLAAGAGLAAMGVIILADASPEGGTVTKGLRLLAGLVAPGRRVITACAVVGCAVLWLWRCELGFESTAGFIQKTLGASYRTDHFVIYYDPAAIDGAEIRRIGIEHEYCLHRVLNAFALPSTASFSSYVYPSADAKMRLIGAGNTEIAKPWSGQIHLSQQSLDASLTHELVHAVAAPFGVPVLRASLSTGLVEGLAMAVENEWGNRTLHEYAAAMREYGAAPDIRSLMSLWGFARAQSSVSYVLTGSFCRFLIDRYGMRRLASVYRSRDYEGVYGRSFDHLAAEWQAYLSRVPLDAIDEDGVDALFRRPPLFAKTCPRALAHRVRTARSAFLRREYAAAESLYVRAYADGHGQDALAGWLASALRQGKYSVLTGAMDSIVLKDERPARYLGLFLGMGDAYLAAGDTERAFTLYDRVYHADLSEGHTEAASLRILALDIAGAVPGIFGYFRGELSDSARIAFSDSLVARGDSASPLLLYMRGRARLRAGDDAGGVADFDKAPLAALDTDLDALRLRLLGQALYRLGRFDDARVAFWNSLNAVDTDVAHERVDVWIDRCEWRMHAER
jgi:tetratricopeptide (TPR) repeat protein